MKKLLLLIFCLFAFACTPAVQKVERPKKCMTDETLYAYVQQGHVDIMDDTC